MVTTRARSRPATQDQALGGRRGETSSTSRKRSRHTGASLGSESTAPEPPRTRSVKKRLLESSTAAQRVPKKKKSSPKVEEAELPVPQQLKVEKYMEQFKLPDDPGKRYRAWAMETKAAVRTRGGRHAAYTHEKFVRMVLEGHGHCRGFCYSPEECLEASTEYLASLQSLYPNLVLEPYVLSEDDLRAYEAADGQARENMELFKLLNRRFIVWTPSGKKRGKWDSTMENVWGRLYNSMASTSFADVEANSEEATEMSCLITKTKWKDGRTAKEPVEGTVTLNGIINDVIHSSNNGKMYFTDGTLPNYSEKSLSMDAPGLSCAVNDGANGMLPLMLRSNRPESLLNFMKVESTGTSTFTFFLPLGGGANITAFHLETKRLRSLNCGTGDLIFQPLATEDNLRKMERIHCAIFGNFERHGQMLPIEMYLEEGIEIVGYLRNKGYAECVELPFLSSHAFVSYGSILSTPAPYKVSCNDMSLKWEPFTTYFLEEIAKAEKEHMLGGEKQWTADSWMESVYLASCDYSPSSQSPWKGELVGQRKTKYPGSEPQNRSQDMQTCVVRLAERLLDLINDQLKEWVLEGAPTKDQALEALKSLLPALQDVWNGLKEGPGKSRVEQRDGVHYVRSLIGRIRALVEVNNPLTDLLNKSAEQRMEFIEACVAQGSILSEQPDSFHGAWLLWSMSLMMQAEVLKRGRHDLLAGVKLLRKRVEAVLEKFCTNRANELSDRADRRE